jgi:hypothetical protein
VYGSHVAFERIFVTILAGVRTHEFGVLGRRTRGQHQQKQRHKKHKHTAQQAGFSHPTPPSHKNNPRDLLIVNLPPELTNSLLILALIGKNLKLGHAVCQENFKKF